MLVFPSMSQEQSDMYRAMQERTHERLKEWDIHILKKMFDIRRIHYQTFVGLFGWSCPELRTKWLLRPHALNLGGGWCTPGDIARDYLALKYPKRRVRTTRSQWLACVDGRRKSPPLYCKPGEMEHAIYLDLSGAYWQIIRAVGWNVEYNPGRWLISLSRMTDFPFPREKVARNCLVSVGLPNALRIWTGSELTFIRKPNRFVNLTLWRLVQDVLNGVAADMLSIGAVYVYTDGYVLPEDTQTLAYEVLDEWGLIGKVKFRGSAHIKAPAAYKFVETAENGCTTDTHQTKMYTRNRREKTVRKVYDDNKDWLRKRFRTFAQIALQEWYEWDNPSHRIPVNTDDDTFMDEIRAFAEYDAIIAEKEL